MKSVISLFGLALMLTLVRVEAVDGILSATGHSNGIISVPLFLLIQGNGRVVPLKNGQMLPVGHEFEMNAFPDRGYEFAYWSPVNVFTDSEVVYDDDVPVATNSSVTISVSPAQIQHRSLRFTMQPVEVIVDVPGVRTLTRSGGWQATFVKRH